MTDFAKNTILYGPPGTGKTYNTVIYAVAIIEEKNVEEVKNEDYSEVLERYNSYKADKRIEFVTFHQSYGYEEFIEGIKPVVKKDKIIYKTMPGVFKRFCAGEDGETEEQRHRGALLDHEEDEFNAENGHSFGSENAEDFVPNVWRVSIAFESGEYNFKRDYFENDLIKIADSQTDNRDIFINSLMRKGDIVLAHDFFGNIFGISVIDETEGDPVQIGIIWQRKIRHLYNYNDRRPVFSNFTISREERYCYVKLLDPNNNTVKEILSLIPDAPEYRALYGGTELHSREYAAEPGTETAEGNKVFIIDEINRGNISKIFGELITLIEDSKRIGASESCTAALPYSGELFGVPDNVYILGTMNTADRSIAMLDTALRRRFEFIEMMPDSALLEGVFVGNINIKSMLEQINRRISALYDREHTIGHAYFMPLRNNSNIEELARIFENKIIPLLQEYFYEDYEKIRLVLGDNQKEEKNLQFVKKIKRKTDKLFGENNLRINEFGYWINKEALGSERAYIKIYDGDNRQ